MFTKKIIGTNKKQGIPMIRKSVISVLLLIAVLVSQNAHALYRDDVILLDQTVSSGQAVKHFARSTLKTGNVFSVANGGSAELRAGNSIELRPGFNVQPGGTFLAQKGWAYDTTGPILLAPNDSVELFFQGTDDLILLFADAESEIYSVTLRDHTGTDITSQAEVTDNTLSLSMLGYSDGIYNFTLLLEDMAGNISESAIGFTVDCIPPTTTVSIPGGMLNDSKTVQFTCSEDANIYYSTDGYPPYPGASNTINLVAVQDMPIGNLLIDKFTHLQFYAIDTGENRESVNREIYYLETIPEGVEVNAFYNPGLQAIHLWWGMPPESIGYKIYRAHTPFEIALLNDSVKGQYLPPSKLSIVKLGGYQNDYPDSTYVPGITYWYGVSVLYSDGSASAIPRLTKWTEFNGSADAITKGLAWLESNQLSSGFWGDREGLQMLATSQALNAFAIAGDVPTVVTNDSAGIHEALFYLRGHRADNNDFLSRKIITLKKFNQNVNRFVYELIAQAKIADNDTIVGWGLSKRYSPDAIDTALANAAIEGENTYFPNHSKLTLNESFLKSDDGYYGWLPGDNDSSVYVSSMVYSATETSSGAYEWIIAGQAGGQFGAGVVDTAGALLWLEMTDPQRTAAKNWLILQQETDGSWQHDCYLTALCLEALLK